MGWSAELADYVIATDSTNAAAREVKARALTELGERQINANARNYYLSAAHYLLRGVPKAVARTPGDRVRILRSEPRGLTRV